jgi:Predicted metal-binding protein
LKGRPKDNKQKQLCKIRISQISDKILCNVNFFKEQQRRQKMDEKVKVGIIICDRYRTCAGGKCLRSLRNREGAFSIYKDREVELVGYTTCGGCPGGNIEYAPEEMIKNGANVIHFATGMVVGYPGLKKL